MRLYKDKKKKMKLKTMRGAFSQNSINRENEKASHYKTLYNIPTKRSRYPFIFLDALLLMLCNFTRMTKDKG